MTIGKILRTSNLAGPCAEEGTIIGETKSFYLVQGDKPWERGKPRRFRKDGIGKFSRSNGGTPHIEPCKRCEDHPETSYPNGYEN
jgi:hypothetical protein